MVASCKFMLLGLILLQEVNLWLHSEALKLLLELRTDCVCIQILQAVCYKLDVKLVGGD